MTRADIRGALAGFVIVTVLLWICWVAASAPLRLLGLRAGTRQ